MEEDVRIREVLEFWFAAPGDPHHNRVRAEWFRKSDAFDAEIRTRFGTLIDEALAGKLEPWRQSVDGTLAYILVLDQFTRNSHRGTPKSFAGDKQALTAARALVANGADRTLPGVRRQFAYLPFEHAEDMAMQDESMRLFTDLGASDPALADLPTWAEKHRVIVARFGRFPHRNAILGRTNTSEEEAFLREPGSSF